MTSPAGHHRDDAQAQSTYRESGSHQAKLSRACTRYLFSDSFAKLTLSEAEGVHLIWAYESVLYSLLDQLELDYYIKYNEKRIVAGSLLGLLEKSTLSRSC